MAHDARMLLTKAEAGDADALRAVTPLVYDQLRELAGRFISDLGNGTVILRRTALVHEAYLKLAGSSAADWRTQTHFCAVAARAMRQVLIDHVREQNRQKRGGGWRRVTLQGLPDEVEGDGEFDIEVLDRALIDLAELDGRAAEIVQLRFFGGMSEPAIGLALGVSERTVRNDWTMARAWLRTRLDGSQPVEAS